MLGNRANEERIIRKVTRCHVSNLRAPIESYVAKLNFCCASYAQASSSFRYFCFLRVPLVVCSLRFVIKLCLVFFEISIGFASLSKLFHDKITIYKNDSVSHRNFIWHKFTLIQISILEIFEDLLLKWITDFNDRSSKSFRKLCG